MLTPAAEQHALASDHIKMWKQVHEKAAEQADDVSARKNALQNGERLIQYAVPLKGNVQSRLAYVVDWTPEMFLGAAAKALPVSNESNATMIRENTIAFENWARSRKK